MHVERALSILGKWKVARRRDEEGTASGKGESSFAHKRDDSLTKHGGEPFYVLSMPSDAQPFTTWIETA